MLNCGIIDPRGRVCVPGGSAGLTRRGGGIIAFAKGQLGIVVYSPPLDGRGNSVRGILACKELASHLGLHAFEFINVGSNFMQWMSN